MQGIQFGADAQINDHLGPQKVGNTTKRRTIKLAVPGTRPLGFRPFRIFPVRALSTIAGSRGDRSAIGAPLSGGTIGSRSPRAKKRFSENGSQTRSGVKLPILVSATDKSESQRGAGPQARFISGSGSLFSPKSESVSGHSPDGTGSALEETTQFDIFGGGTEKVAQPSAIGDCSDADELEVADHTSIRGPTGSAESESSPNSESVSGQSPNCGSPSDVEKQ
eukprot:CAMPEP_0114547092 /NCGR_PEP_ID=MMETSP0114-20121206/4284_1 /TAXON_ID=31324 /ORGANISM="Goniomonas sp, Strain m" /LENGTH=221 /DNA_ID=CAMNT_0001731633 /DNA_START=248 /DNA_END=913 /DNA_ORIENTATION=-